MPLSVVGSGESAGEVAVIAHAGTADRIPSRPFIPWRHPQINVRCLSVMGVEVMPDVVEVFRRGHKEGVLRSSTPPRKLSLEGMDPKQHGNKKGASRDSGKRFIREIGDRHAGT